MSEARQAMYVPPFKLIKDSLNLNESEIMTNKNIEIPTALFKFLMSLLISSSTFDERWYFETYPDVKAAVSQGDVASALDHYISAGYYEGRSPGPAAVNREFYLENYADVAEGVRDGRIVDISEHFNQNGYFEGRVSVPEHLAELRQWLSVLRRR